MIRIGYILTACVLLCSCGQQPPKVRPSSCGVCGNAVVPISSISDDTSKPSLNIAVWDRSSCGNLLFWDDDVICTQCRSAYSSLFKKWLLALEDPTAFHQPLHHGIRHFPLPDASNIKSLVVYDQVFSITDRTDSVAFWYLGDDIYLSRIQSYASTNSLDLNVNQPGRLPDQVFIKAEYRNESNKAMDDTAE